MPVKGEFITSYAPETIGHAAVVPDQQQKTDAFADHDAIAKHGLVMRKTQDLTPYGKNPRNNDGAVDAVAASIKTFGFKVPLVIDSQGVVVCGHTRLKAAIKLGIAEIPCVIADDLTPEQIKAFRLADNKVAEIATWDKEILRDELLSLADLDFDMRDFGFSSVDTWEQREGKSLADRYIVPPFSVLDSRQDSWQENKTEWEARIGQGGNIDPVLCNVVFKWFCPERGAVFAPFPGGGTPGKVAAELGLECAEGEQAAGGKKFDFAFICPPPEAVKDITRYRQMITGTIDALKDNAFFVAVVGNSYDDSGVMQDFTGDTKRAALQAGCKLLNDIIFVEPVAITAKQATKQFNAGRRLAGNHKNVLVFVKGNEKLINMPKCEENEAGEAK